MGSRCFGQQHGTQRQASSQISRCASKMGSTGKVEPPRSCTYLLHHDQISSLPVVQARIMNRAANIQGVTAITAVTLPLSQYALSQWDSPCPKCVKTSSPADG